MYRNVQATAEGELERSSVGLAFSGLSAGLNLSFSFVAAALFQTLSDDPAHAHLWGAVGYPIGFILVITARAQLFTENSLTPVILVLSRPTRANIVNTLRLWAVVLAANLAGAFLFSLGMTELNISRLLDPATLLDVATAAYEGTWHGLLVRGVLGGWLIALIVWVLHAGAGLVGQIVLVWLIAFLIQAAGFSHSVAGATEVLYLAHTGTISYLDWFRDFQVPVTLGNLIGGVVFVALVNYGQAVGAGRDLERAELRQEREDSDRERVTTRRPRE